jgi:hypothetical protein
MPSSYSTNLRFELQFTGENINLWGDKLNATFSRVDDSIAGYVAITIPATGDYALTSANSNASADEARRAHLKLTGSPAANFTITIPSVSKNYWIWNATTKVATITTGSGATVTIDAGDKFPVWSDGTNVNHGVYFGGYPLKDYIAAISASAGAVPGTTGALGKFLKVTVDGSPSTWQQIQSTDLGDFDAEVRRRTLVYSLIFGGA